MNLKKYNTGIYQIVNLINNKRYIGSAVHLKNRKCQHFNGLKIKKHFNEYLQRAYNKYGKENFKFKTLLYCPKKDLIKYEQIMIDYYDFKTLYNILPTAGSPLGYKCSEETKIKISKANSGENNGNYGKKMSKETLKKCQKYIKKGEESHML